MSVCGSNGLSYNLVKMVKINNLNNFDFRKSFFISILNF